LFDCQLDIFNLFPVGSFAIELIVDVDDYDASFYEACIPFLTFTVY